MTRSCFTKERFAPKGRISALESAAPWKTPPASHLLGLPVGKTCNLLAVEEGGTI